MLSSQQHIITQPRVVCDRCGPAVGVVINGDAGAAHAAFFDDAVCRVIGEVKGFTVFVDQLQQAVSLIVGEGHSALLSIRRATKRAGWKRGQCKFLMSNCGCCQSAFPHHIQTC